MPYMPCSVCICAPMQYASNEVAMYVFRTFSNMLQLTCLFGSHPFASCLAVATSTAAAATFLLFFFHFLGILYYYILRCCWRGWDILHALLLFSKNGQAIDAKNYAPRAISMIFDECAILLLSTFSDRRKIPNKINMNCDQSRVCLSCGVANDGQNEIVFFFVCYFEKGSFRGIGTVKMTPLPFVVLSQLSWIHDYY